MKFMLTKMEKPGTVELNIHDLKRDVVKALSLHLVALRAQGHAISADETFDTTGRSIGFRVYHYLSCKICNPKGENYYHGKV